MESLSSNDIIEINKKVGEKGTVVNHGNLDFTVQKANAEKSLTKRAAILLHGIITGHVFLDGNKRTALVSAIALIEANGKKVTIKDNEALDLVYGIANEKYNISKISEIIKKCIE